jgi:hypothetical protein
MVPFCCLYYSQKGGKHESAEIAQLGERTTEVSSDSSFVRSLVRSRLAANLFAFAPVFAPVGT